MNNSIKRFLLTYITLAVIVLYAFISVVSYSVSKDELDELYDANLEQVANTIAAQTLPNTYHYDPATKGQENSKGEIKSEEEFYVRVLNDQDKILYISHPAISVPIPITIGFSNQQSSNREWRFFTIKTDKQTVQVAQSLDLRKTTIADAAFSLISSQLLFIPILVILIFFAIKQALDPVTKLSNAIQNRLSTELQPFPQSNVPLEIKPLVEALNLFIGRVSEMIAVIKRFTSDAAHELRTPITALKLQLSVLENADTPLERDDAIRNLKSGIERSEQLVTQLLTLAKIEPNSHVRKLEKVELLELTKESIEALLPLSSAKSIDIGLKTFKSAYIHAVREEIKILINNIIDNAIRYTPKNGQVDISIFLNSGQVILEVIDNGTGVSSNDLEHIFERFYRGENKDSVGSGLGLSIVKEIADQHGAKIEIRNMSPGFLFRISINAYLAD